MVRLKLIEVLLAIAALSSLAACQSVGGGSRAGGGEFSIERTNPEALVNPALFGYSHVVTVNNGRMIYLAGQGPTDPKGHNAAPGDLRGQARQAVDNILVALAAVGAGPENIVKLRINIKDYSPRQLIEFMPEIGRLTPPGGMPPAAIVIGVESLVIPTTLIEIETIAAMP